MAVAEGADTAEVDRDILLEVFERLAEEERAAAKEKPKKAKPVVKVDGVDCLLVHIPGTAASYLQALKDGRRKYILPPRPNAGKLQDKTLLAASVRSCRKAAAGECQAD